MTRSRPIYLLLLPILTLLTVGGCASRGGDSHGRLGEDDGYYPDEVYAGDERYSGEIYAGGADGDSGVRENYCTDGEIYYERQYREIDLGVERRTRYYGPYAEDAYYPTGRSRVYPLPNYSRGYSGDGGRDYRRIDRRDPPGEHSAGGRDDGRNGERYRAGTAERLRDRDQQRSRGESPTTGGRVIERRPGPDGRARDDRVDDGQRRTNIPLVQDRTGVRSTDARDAERRANVARARSAGAEAENLQQAVDRKNADGPANRARERDNTSAGREVTRERPREAPVEVGGSRNRGEISPRESSGRTNAGDRTGGESRVRQR